MWHNFSNIIKVTSLLSGSAAIASLSAMNNTLTLLSGIIFATLQAVEFASNPANISAKSLAQKKQYATLHANKNNYNDEELEKEYDLLIADDSVTVCEALKEISYNDVAKEKGACESELYNLTFKHKFYKFIS